MGLRLTHAVVRGYPIRCPIMLSGYHSPTTAPCRTCHVRRRRMRKTGQWWGESCYGPCVVFKDEAVATPWGRMRGAVKGTNRVAFRTAGSLAANSPPTQAW